jgi:hypothetical protein
MACADKSVRTRNMPKTRAISLVEEPSYEISDEMFLFRMTADRVVKRHLALCNVGYDAGK